MIARKLGGSITHLKILDLGNNMITKVGGKVFMSMLEYNDSLETVYVNNNLLGDEAA
jgi:Leucine-rich repeat (LRR) protein